MSFEKMQISFGAFKEKIIRIVGEDGAIFEERGKYGWTSVDDILDGKPGGNPGPHWCDVSPRKRGQKLYAHYDYNTETATFFPLFLQRERSKENKESS